jgi:hypothetical protein
MTEPNDALIPDSPATSREKPFKKSSLTYLSSLLGIVGEINRLKILATLHGGRRMSVQGLAHHSEGNPSVVSRHLKLLRTSGIVEWIPIQDEDLRICHHRLKPGSEETDANGQRWINLGKVKICLD